MTPSHIRLFDGMRVTTEHLDHLQAAFLTAISDLRLLHTEFPVVAGFDVTVQDNQVTVEPGLAFDFDGQRIYCDTAQSFDLAAHSEQTDWFVLAEYRQTETGEVEGKFTLIWDSCSIYLSDAEVNEGNNAVVLAKLETSEDGIEVQSSADYYEAKAELAAEQESSAKGDRAEAGEAAEDGDETPDEDPGATHPDPGAQLPGDNPDNVSDTTPVVNGDGQIEEETASAVADVPLEPPPAIRVTQGFERLGGDTSVDLTTLMLGDLRASVDTGAAAPSWLLKEHLMTTDISPVSIAAQTESTVEIQLEAAAEADPETAAEEPAALLPEELHSGEGPAEPGGPFVQLQSNGTAEVSLDMGDFKQVSTSHVTGRGHVRAFLRDGQINHLPLLDFLTDGDEPPLSLQSRLTRQKKKPVIEIRLVWEGEVTGAQISRLEKTSVVLHWTTHVAWKAADIAGLP